MKYLGRHGSAMRLTAWALVAGCAYVLPGSATAASDCPTARTAGSDVDTAPNASDLASQRVQHYLGEWLKRFADRSDVQPEPGAMARARPARGFASVEVRPLAASVRPSARMAVWVDLIDCNGSRQSVLVTSRVHAYRDAWVARRDMPAGTSLDEKVLERMTIDVAAVGSTPWQGRPSGMMLTSNVLRGAALTERLVAEAPAVSRGGRVWLVTRVGGVEVRSAALALQEGDVGERIKVRADAARTPVEATVLERGMVEVRP